MGGVEDPAPEYPDPLPPHVEERYGCEPKSLIAVGERSQPGSGQLQHPLDVGLHRRLVTNRKERLDWWFGQSDELGKETPLRENLMSEDLADRAAPGMKPELELIVVQLAPDRRQLIGLGHVGIHQVLQDRPPCLGDISIRDEFMGVPHGASRVIRPTAPALRVTA